LQLRYWDIFHKSLCRAELSGTTVSHDIRFRGDLVVICLKSSFGRHWVIGLENLWPIESSTNFKCNNAQHLFHQSRYFERL